MRALITMGLLALLFGCSREPDFVREGDAWRYRGHVLEGIDSASFEPLGRHYARDAGQAIYFDTYRDSRDYFTTARLRVTRVAGAEVASFRILDDDHARDAKRIYYEGRPVAVKDAASFALLDDGFARDRVSGYYLRSPVAGSDGASFATLGAHYARDVRRAWWCDLDYARDGPAQPRCAVLEGADPAAIEILDRGYARSAGRVFHRGRALRDVDAASFAVDSSYAGPDDARDARGAFRDGKRVDVAAATVPPAR